MMKMVDNNDNHSQPTFLKHHHAKLCALYIVSHLILPITVKGTLLYYLRLRDEKTEDERGHVTAQGHRADTSVLGHEARSLWSGPRVPAPHHPGE